MAYPHPIWLIWLKHICLLFPWDPGIETSWLFLRLVLNETERQPLLNMPQNSGTVCLNSLLTFKSLGHIFMPLLSSELFFFLPDCFYLVLSCFFFVFFTLFFSPCLPDGCFIYSILYLFTFIYVKHLILHFIHESFLTFVLMIINTFNQIMQLWPAPNPGGKLDRQQGLHTWGSINEHKETLWINRERTKVGVLFCMITYNSVVSIWNPLVEVHVKWISKCFPN